jgi:hypothetical protein
MCATHHRSFDGYDFFIRYVRPVSLISSCVNLGPYIDSLFAQSRKFGTILTTTYDTLQLQEVV